MCVCLTQAVAVWGAAWRCVSVQLLLLLLPPLPPAVPSMSVHGFNLHLRGRMFRLHKAEVWLVVDPLMDL